MRGENRWPTESLPGFEQCLSDYFRRLRSFGRVLARNVALSLELPEDFFDKDLTHPGCSAVIAHYPPQPPKTDHFGIDPHSDSECKQRFSPSFANRGRWLTVHIVFTILAPGEVRALEVLNKRGSGCQHHRGEALLSLILAINYSRVRTKPPMNSVISNS